MIHRFRQNLFTGCPVPGLTALVIVLSVLGSTTAQPNPHIASTDPLPPEKERQAFQLPPGFEAQLVASEPAIQKPMNMAFDAKGRLWVTDSTEYPFPVKGDRKGRDRVVILSDFDENGKAQKVDVFADGLNIPIGVLPMPSCDSAIVFSIPYLWRFTDTDGDGKADKREKLLGVFGQRDTHGLINGLRFGFDGWIYADHGFANTSTVTGKDGSRITMNSGNTFRFRPDGTQVEHYTFGQVNPFGMTFDEWGNIYTADCHSKPITQLLRGAYYSSFGKPHDGIGFGPDMIQHTHHSTALCGLVYYAADHFPVEYYGSMFLGNVTANRINHDRIQWHGSSPEALEQPDFLVSKDPWFRPVDIRLGPDGALYVADFYNRIIGHYEVPLDHPGRDRHRGRIWRIVWKGLEGEANPPHFPRDWSEATFKELTTDLGHPNLEVRKIAMNQLVHRFSSDGGSPRELKAWTEFIQGDTDSTEDAQRAIHGLWVLERTGRLDDQLLAKAAGHRNPLIRVHAMRVFAEREKISEEQRKLLRKRLKDTRELVKRTAAEALGQHPSPDDFSALLNLRLTCPLDDTHLLHVVRMTLRNVLRAFPDHLNSLDPLKDKEVLAVADIALALDQAQASRFLLAHLSDLHRLTGTDLFASAVHHIARYGEDDQLSDVLSTLRDPDLAKDLTLQLAAFRAIQRGSQERGAKLSAAVIRQATDLALQAVKSGQVGKMTPGVELAGALRLPELREPLREITQKRSAPRTAREAAFPALVSIDANAATEALPGVIDDPGELIELRERAVQALANINTGDARKHLLNSLTVAPARLQRAIAVGLATTPPGAEALLNAVKEGKASARLLQEQAVVVKLRERQVPRLNERLAELTKGLPSADEKLLALINQRRTGYRQAETDLDVGAKVFEKNCAICHQIGNEGAKIGPQLDGIGNRGLERILEDVLDPSRNVDNALRTTSFGLKDGRFIDGLVLREEGKAIVLADREGKEVRIDQDNVAERIISPVSPMPADAGEKIPEDDFYHLIRYLLAQRQKSP